MDINAERIPWLKGSLSGLGTQRGPIPEVPEPSVIGVDWLNNVTVVLVPLYQGAKDWSMIAEVAIIQAHYCTIRPLSLFASTYCSPRPEVCFHGSPYCRFVPGSRVVQTTYCPFDNTF
ncbi:Uncharacterized protein HZ326_30719 [Fusarium oxysporum f. sp. albedinis]|nr:Uncharacterized protein HZ326_30719 [Fusarium oxysporum f. sp. albedinis]